MFNVVNKTTIDRLKVFQNILILFGIIVDNCMFFGYAHMLNNNDIDMFTLITRLQLGLLPITNM